MTPKVAVLQGLRPANPHGVLRRNPELGPIHLLPSSPPKGDSYDTRLASRAAQQIGIEATRISFMNDPAQPEPRYPSPRIAAKASSRRSRRVALPWKIGG